MNTFLRSAIWVSAAVILHLSIYLYLDQILLAPTSTFEVSAVAGAHNVTSGKAYYSRDRRYMAITADQAVEIYAMPGKKLLRTIEVGEQGVSYFKWLEDRDLALMALYASDKDAKTTRVTLTNINPLRDDSELAATIKDLPANSKVTDITFSTATNVIYMQVAIGNAPDTYRVYRTDANHSLDRVFLTSNRIGRIATFYDQDCLVYDNLEKDTVIARFLDGSWKIISPQVGKYRLIGVDHSNIYIAKLNKDGLADNILLGRLQAGFEEYRKLPAPVDVSTIKLAEIL